MRSSLSPQQARSCTGLSVLILLTLLSHVCLAEQKIANVYTHNDSNFQKLVLHEETRAMFLGAQNKLYRLSLDLTCQQEVSLGPANDSHLCLNPKHECMYELKLRDEQVKLLLVSPEGDELLVCGNLHQGSCAKVAAHNITQLTWAYEPVVGVESDTVFSSTAAVVTKDDALFVANSVNTRTSHHDQNPVGITEHKAPFLATRNYSTLGFHYSTSSQMKINTSTMFRAIHRFAFTYVDSAYFLVTREVDQNSDEAATFIGRTCETDPGYHSYVEAQLSCNIDDIQLNFVEDAYVGTPGHHLATALRIQDKEELLFVTFSELQNSTWDRGQHSGLCVYRLADIHKNLTQSIQNCFNGEGSTGPYHLAHPSPCIVHNSTTKDNYCHGSNINFPIASNEVMAPIINRSFTNTNLSAITVSIVGPYTVVYLGTHSGEILKVEMDSANAMPHRNIVIQPGNAILPDMLLSSDGASLYVMTSSMVARVEVQDCGSHMGCKTCMTAADPHCGWCSASQRCTAKDDCLAGTLTWRKMGTGHCRTIISTQPNLTHPGTPIDVPRPDEVQHCGSYTGCETCMTAADPHCGWCSASKRCTAEDDCQAGTLGWNKTRTGRCPAIISAEPDLPHAEIPIKNSPMDSSVLTIVTIAIFFIVFNLTMATAAIIFIAFLLIFCVYLCQQRCKEGHKYSGRYRFPLPAIPLTRFTTQNRVVEDVESSDSGPLEVMPSSVPMDEAKLQSLIKDIMDPQLQETVKDAFVPSSQIALHNKIGTGHFGCVYAGLLQIPEKENVKVRVAVKTLHGCTLDPEAVESFLKEGVMMKNLNHPHVLRLLGVSVSDQGKNPLVILPYMAQGDLHNYIKNKKKRFTCQYLLQLGQQVSQGMAYLAQCRIIHRDLAARNCMMDENSQVKVADFGLSKDLYDKEYYVTQTLNRKMPVRWMALESLKDSIFTTESDVWSFGVLLWELMTHGKMPYPDVHSSNIRAYLDSGDRLKKPENCPEDVYTLMCECWQTSPSKRPTFADLVNQLELIVNKPLYSNFRFPSFHNRLSLHPRKGKRSAVQKVSNLSRVK